MSARLSRRALIASIGGLAALASRIPSAVPADKLPGAAPFRVYDSLFYLGKPDVAALGMLPARGTGELWRAGQPRSVVDEIGVQRAVDCCRDFAGVFYLDVEHWCLFEQPDAVIDANLEKFVRLATVVRRAAPGLTFGYYGVLPEIVYWPIVQPVGNQLEVWRATNRRARAIAPHVDVIFPSLYTFYADVAGWEKYAAETLREARQYGKPVYAFLWPEFHDSNKLLGGRNVPADYWRRELELCRQYADGVVIWGGWQKRWAGDAGWWQETKSFLATLRPETRA
ncbi:MAG TPA: hypothetical protein VMF52_05940 [Steroidobacteraceae bacterium]|nr:hypothetical protein [Steroidobacteraceae bacterium]